MKRSLLAAAALALLTTAAQAGELQIKMGRWAVKGQTMRALVMIKNDTDTDYATVTWSCDLHDPSGYKTGYGTVTFHGVPQYSLAVGYESFYQNGITHSVTCKRHRRPPTYFVGWVP